eukprot:INCI4403.1.p1 GENE.INCI4403.1~~INCI4403.1.p1  ORF type:complete len:1790 (-),score=258.98 INCI4403.1:108-5477(-)
MGHLRTQPLARAALLLVVVLALAPTGAATKVGRGQMRGESRYGRKSKVRHNLKFKHQPVGPEEDWHADNLFPRHLFTHLRDKDASAAAAATAGHEPAGPAHGERQLADDPPCTAAMCHGYTCTTLLAASYTCEELTGVYACDSCYDCSACEAPAWGDDDGGCQWPSGKPTSCGAAHEADCYVDNMEAAELGLTHPFRVKYIRQYVNALASDPRRSSATCYAVGQIVDPCYFDYGRDRYRCPVTCTEDDVLTPEKVAFVNERLDWAEEHLANLFQTVDLYKPLELEASTVSGSLSNLRQTSYPDHDIAIVVTLHPSGVGAGIAGYAIPLQSYAGTDTVEDPATRVVVAHYNWCPDQIKVDNLDSKSEMSKAARLIMHETLHTMNAVKTDSRYHANAWGGQRCAREIFVDSVEEWSGVYTRKVVTNRTLTVAREQFGCDTLEGVPIENQYIGYGSHWESRVTGPEVLAYGENTGESYISDLTLAFIEDLGFFVANYSAAGRFGEPNHEDATDSESFLAKLQSGPASGQSVTFENAGLSPGYLRWGRHAGCAFVFGPPSEWPAEYLCTEDRADGCTPDRRLTARCSLTSWGGVGETLQLFYRPTASGKSWEPITWNSYIPDAFDVLDEGVQADSLGFSDAMDFVPVRIGYWNCLDEKPPSDLDQLFTVTSEITNVNENTTAEEVAARDEEEEGEKVDINDLFDGLTDSLAGDVGGQSFCEHCRCFESGLVPVNDIVNFDPTFARKGLCYQFNCYADNYLQVGIKSGTQLNWYACPPEGGPLYIAGFFGSLECPVASKFCANEVATSVLLTEIDPQLEWVLWGLLAGAIGILFLVWLACYRRIDHKIRFCCGINQDGRHFAKILARSQGRKSGAGWLLTIFGSIWLIVGLGLVGLGLYALVPETELLWDTQSRQVPLLCGAGLGVVALSATSIHGAWKRVPSIALIAYFYVVLLLFLGIAFVAVIPFLLGPVYDQLLETLWPGLKSSFPNSWQAYNASTAMLAIEDVVSSNLASFVAGGCFVVLSMLVGIICSYLNLTAHVITRNFEMIMNLVFFGMGIFALWSGLTRLVDLSDTVFIAMVTGSCMLTFTGLLGTLAACQRHEECFKAYAFFGVINVLVQLTAGLALLYIGDVILDAGVEVASTFCSTVYENSTSCLCEASYGLSTTTATGTSTPFAAGIFDECLPTCVTTNTTCDAQTVALETDQGIEIGGMGMCSMHFDPDAIPEWPSTNTTIAGATTLTNVVVNTAFDNETNVTTMAPPTTSTTSTTTTRGGRWYSGWYSCNMTESFVVTPTPKIPGTMGEFLQSLNDTELVLLARNHVVHDEAEDFSSEEEALAALDRRELLAFVELDCILYGLILLMLCAFQILLLITNQVIIHWNHENDHPHGKDPHWRLMHVAFNKRKAVAKVHAIAAFKKAGMRKLGFANIKVSPEELDSVHRWSVQIKLQQEAFGEGVWGLGMTFSERQLEDDGDYGRKIVEVSGFRTGEDDDGIEVMSPGLAAGLKAGDRIIAIDGHKLLGGVKEFALEVGEAKYLESVTLLVERVMRQGTRKHKKKGRQLPAIDEHSGLVGMDGWEPELAYVELGGDSNSPVGMNISEIYGSGNEGYGVEKAYLTVNTVSRGSRAEQFGIHPHDTIVAVDGHLVFSTKEFASAVHGKKSPMILVHRVTKDGPRPSLQQQYNVQVNLDPDGMGGIGLGARLIEIGAMMWRKDVPDHRQASTFVMVNKLVAYHDGSNRAGPAEAAGMMQYDLIVKVNGEEIYSILELVNALKSKRSPTLTIRRAGRKTALSAWQ